MEDGAAFGEEVGEGFGLDFGEFAVESVGGSVVTGQFAGVGVAVHGFMICLEFIF